MTPRYSPRSTPSRSSARWPRVRARRPLSGCVPREGRGRPVHYGAVDLQPGTAVDNPTPRAGREHVVSSTERRTSSRSMVPPGYKPKSQSGSASCAPVAREPPSGAATTPEISARRSSIVRMPTILATWSPGTTGDDLPAGCPDHAGSTCRRHALGCVESFARGLVAGGGEPAGCRSCRSACPSRRCKFGAAVRDQTSGRRGCWPSSACAGGKWAAGR